MIRRNSPRRCLRLHSFAAEIRRQLASGTASGPRRSDRAELSGLLDGAGERFGDDISFRTRSAAVARSVVRLWSYEFSVETKISPASPDRFGRTIYSVTASGNRAVQAAEELRAVRHSRDASARSDYLRGAFQAAGSVVKPGSRGGHHLEFVHTSDDFLERIVAFSRAPLKLVERRGRFVAYTKSADGVTTVLSQMGLHDAVLEYEARAILGEAKANANRVTNFDSANAGRTAKAAASQQRALERLDPAKLPDALAEMLSLRLDHPDASLTELARLSGLTKSAVNHRLRRLVAISEKTADRTG